MVMIMTIKEIEKQLEKQTKIELLDLIVLMMNKNDNNRQLIDNKIDDKNSNTVGLERRIRRKIKSHDVFYYEVYKLLTDYYEISINKEKILELSKEVLEYFFIELEAYGHRYPETLLDYSLNIFDIALKAAKELQDTESADELYCMIRFEQDGFYDCFYEIFFKYFNTDEDDNVIMSEKE